MSEKLSCEWCGSDDVKLEKRSVYWELPEGTRAVEIKETPTACCVSCGMEYQKEAMVKEIEDQLFLIDRSKLGKEVLYEELMQMPRLLKRNYFDFTQ
ncbi:YokU family protein [Falsibacillus pallidus]|uniref:YokU family protein n=1 Tax=Falsibacillus pallidus TaxID=493781 RepID=UPI003D98707F